jgi:hypothetical protein
LIRADVVYAALPQENTHMTDAPDQIIEAAQGVAATLDQRGHAEHASTVRAALKHAHPEHEHPLRNALREACQVVLTAIEAIDPVSATMVEELRLAVDARLLEKRDPA